MKNRSAKHIIFLCPYPKGGAPSQRFRFEQYLDLLKEQGFTYQIEGFLDEKTNQILYKPGQTGKKLIGVMLGFLRRIYLLFSIPKADFVFIHREATPIGPPFIEWIIAKLLRKKIIYDFDDAIWLKDASGVNNFMLRLKWQQKVSRICQWSYNISAGNAYLCAYAKQFQPQVALVPTTIDTEQHHNRIKQQSNQPLTIGWTGSHSTMKYLKSIERVLQQLEEQFDFQFVVISNRPPELALKNLKFIQWNEANEVEDLLQLHIGLMPLPDDPWARGKCGFKALQYLALGIPALVSPVGVNTKIVEHGVNGYVCATDHDWHKYLSILLQDAELRENLGEEGRKKIVKEYSVKANTQNFINLFS